MCEVWCGVVWYGVVWCGEVWCGVVWYVRSCIQCGTFDVAIILVVCAVFISIYNFKVFITHVK